MKINLKYGKRGLDVDIECAGGRIDVFRTQAMPSIPNSTGVSSGDLAAHLRECLEKPIGSVSLREMAAGRKNACIVVSDITRPVPNKALLPSIIETLQNAGITGAEISILVATGIHRAPTEQELDEMLGAEIIAGHRIISHDARDTSSIRRIGFTSHGTPIEINRHYLESDLKIVVGLVEPHFMAGFSGGRKSVAVGLTSVESIKHLHGTGFLEHPGARNCNLEGNPLHAELVEIAGAAGVDFAVSAVIDAERRVGGIFCGDIIESHRAACAFAGRYCFIRADYSYDIVVTTAGGYPLDTTYYQAVKGLVGALGILSPGGGIILASKCAGGLGSSEFRQMLECLRDSSGYDDFIRHISEPAGFMIDQWEVEMLVKALRRARIYMYSTGISKGDWPLTFAEPVDSVEHGVSLAVGNSRKAPNIAVIPEGPYVVPGLASSERSQS